MNDKTKKNALAGKDELSLFQEAMQDVRPIDQGTVFLARKNEVPEEARLASQQEPDERFTLPAFNSDPEKQLRSGDTLLFSRPGIQQRLMSRLRRGQIVPQARLDLHGNTLAQAQKSLCDFIDQCRGSHRLYALIIHGKGRGSADNFPIMKNAVNQWLQAHPLVLAFCSAHPKDGGTGAVYAILKSAQGDPTKR